MKEKRERQTPEQRTVRDFAALVYYSRPYGASKRKVAKDVWRLCPKGYKNFEAFRRALGEFLR
ncbi:MAG: hypothetical protein IJ829_00125 [Kiritimatiellae bacterium]|nr:hypothetical protein [Kiritimatiellia bacterium]